jgi:hypothetical protein
VPYPASPIGTLTKHTLDIPLEDGVDIPNHQAPWVEEYNLSTYLGQVYEDGVGAIVETIMDSVEPITLICIAQGAPGLTLTSIAVE